MLAGVDCWTVDSDTCFEEVWTARSINYLGFKKVNPIPLTHIPELHWSGWSGTSILALHVQRHAWHSQACVSPAVKEFVLCIIQTLLDSVCVTIFFSLYSNHCFLLLFFSLALFCVSTVETKDGAWGADLCKYPSIIQSTARLCLYSLRLYDIYTDRQLSKAIWEVKCLNHIYSICVWHT